MLGIQTHFNYSANAYGWMSLFIAAAYYLSAHLNRSLAIKFHLQRIFAFGALLIGLSGLVMVLGPDQFLLLLFPMAIATFGQALIFSNTIAGALHSYSHIPGKASAMFSSLQMILVSFISAVMATLPDRLLILGITLIVLAFLSFVCLASVRKEG